jgi:hypothetical protein
MEFFKSNKNKILIGAVIVILILLLIIPVPVSKSISTSGRIFPATEWTVLKDQNGQVLTIERDYRNASTKSYSLNTFERGDAIQFNLISDLRPGSYITAGDTLGYIYSNEAERELSILRGTLSSQKAELIMNRSGEKASLIEMAEGELEAAVKQKELQQSILQRQETLFKNQLISNEEYENELTKYEIYNKNVSIARAQLEAITSGQKSEMLNYIQSQIRSVEREIAVYENRLDRYRLISPMDGELCMNFAGDTLLLIRNSKEYVLVFAVNVAEYSKLKTGKSATMYARGNMLQAHGEVLIIDNSVKVMNGRQFVYALASAETHSGKLLPGMLLECSIQCDKQTLPDLIFSFIGSIFTWN